MRLLQLFILASILLLAWPPTRAAAGERLVVLRWHPTPPSAEAAELEQTVERVRSALRERGYAVQDAATTREQLLAGVQIPVVLTPRDRAALQDLARAAVLAVGRIAPSDRTAAQVETARAAIADTMAFVHAHLEALNREPALATKVLDACLLLPRLAFVEGTSDSSVHSAIELCRKLVPNTKPSKAAHPPEVLAAFAKAEEIDTTAPRANVSVRTSDGCDDCRLYVNGVFFGMLPIVTTMAPGQYRFQVEEPGRAQGAFVHELAVEAGRATMLVTADAERYLWVDEHSLWLEGELGQHAAIPAELLRRAEVERLVLVAPAARSLSAVVFDGRGWKGSCHARGVDPSELAVHVQGCLEMRPGADDARAGAPPTAEPSRTEPRPRNARARPPDGFAARPRPIRNWGIGLVSVGLAAFAGTAIADGVITRAGRSNRLELALASTAFSGAVLITASEPLWLPLGRERAPLWEWTVAAVGLAPLTTGAWLVAQHEKCARYLDAEGHDRCTGRDARATRGYLLLFGSFPLLTLPLFHYVARDMFAVRASLSSACGLGYNAGGACLSLRGTF